MRNPFKKVMYRIFDEMLIAQSFYFKEWVIATFPEEKHVWYISTKYFDRKINHTHKKGSVPFFCIAHNASKQEIFKKLFLLYEIKEKDWSVIFTSSFFSIYQNNTEQKIPTIFSFFKQSSQQELVTIARRVISSLALRAEQVEYKDVINYPMVGGKGQYNVDVTLWVNGEVRGSKIVFDTDVQAGVRASAHLAYYDSRFKRISQEELIDMRIEVVVMSTLALPVLRHDIMSDYIHHDKSYSLVIKNDVAWFLPTVFNCISFEGLLDFTKRLAEEKMNTPFVGAYLNNLFIHQTISCIESSNKKYTFSMNGPLVDFNNQNQRTRENNVFNCEAAVQYIKRIQNDAGNFPARVDPLRGGVYYDLVIMAFTVYSLIFFGVRNKNNDSKDIGRKGLLFLRNHLENTKKENDNILIVVYTALALWYAGDKDECSRLVRFVQDRLKQLSYEPILYSQIAKLFILVYGEHSNYATMSKNFVRAIYNDFLIKKRDNTVNLVLFAELPWLLDTLGEIFGDPISKEDGRAIALWYMSTQKESGAFPCTIGNQFVYVRGVSKIVEALAPLEYIDKEALRKAIVWCSLFQYTKENTYFIEPTKAPYVYGGMRHDYYTQEVWSDATGHTLIARSFLGVF